MRMKIVCCIVIIYCSSYVCWADEVESLAFNEALELYNQGETERVLNIITQYYKREDSKAKYGWYILLGSVYLKQGKYNEAFDAVNTVRSKIENAYNIMSNSSSLGTEDQRKGLDILYDDMILIVA